MNLSAVGFLGAVLAICWAVDAQAVSITQRAGNNFRTAANNREFVLNKSNVNANDFGLLRIHDFNAKVETQPLVVEKGAGSDDLVIITTMKNEVIGINARTNARVYDVKLGPEISSQDMDMWKHTPTWGISATPIIDPATDTLYVAAWLKKDDDNRFRDYWIFALNPLNGSRKAEPVRIFGQSQEGNGCWFNDAGAVYRQNNQTRQYVYPKLRAGLALTENHGLVLAFAANGESLMGGRKNPHGFVVAYDTRGLLGRDGVSRQPAMFCATSFNGWGAGIWHAGGAPVTEGDMIYVATSNGTSNNGDVDLAESMIKLRFVPGSGGARPLLEKVDYYKAFLDERKSGGGCLWRDNNSEVSCGRGGVGSAAADWDFGAAGPMLVPGSSLLLQGTKDGIIYSLDKFNLGKNDRFNQLLSKPPLVASYYGGDLNQNWDRAQHLNRSLPCPASGHSDHGWFMPCGDPENNKMHHIHALALAQRNQTGGIVYVWGENSRLKSYNFSTLDGELPTFRAEGEDMASVGYESPGGMPGGLLMLSGKPSASSTFPHAIDFGSAILWSVYSKFGDANKEFAEGQLVAYDATGIEQGKRMKRLFRTGDDNNGGLGKMSRMIPPVVANGRVYVMIYRVNTDDCTVPDNQLKVCSQLKVYGLR
ncbi:hypothetical protein NP590_00750 [Methylomonas sp. SURF-2]|uniref:Glucose/Sorbosone dehydrogenase domain-containing protein n=1 Tax=Methylomonas subterranea TaxID=2952225 RepID=A0ABT1TB34_9GAMM|nr:hypothetical protein [Methylomonas sp. SURF-2]MCQ8102615.1 hypothetical protein [Methylomonas sp. SURF-2]